MGQPGNWSVGSENGFKCKLVYRLVSCTRNINSKECGNDKVWLQICLKFSALTTNINMTYVLVQCTKLGQFVYQSSHLYIEFKLRLELKNTKLIFGKDYLLQGSLNPIFDIHNLVIRSL